MPITYTTLELVRDAACVLFPASMVTLCMTCQQSQALRKYIAQQIVRAETELRFLRLPLTGKRLVHAQLVIMGSLLVLGMASANAWPLVPCFASWLGPRLWLQRQRRDRTARIELQLDGWLLALANALRASPSLGDAIAASSTVAPAPLSEELSLAIHETNLGLPLDRALDEAARRVRSPVFTAAMATVRIARNTGGDLSRTLEHAAATLREMARLEGVVRTKTAEGKAQAFVIGAVPGPLVYMLHVLDPNLLEPLWSTRTGHLVLTGSVLLWGAAILLARKIVAVDV
jgi:tight adherence protein B